MSGFATARSFSPKSVVGKIFVVNRDDVIERVREWLRVADPHFRFDVVEAGVRLESEWWYVPVVAQSVRGPEPPHDLVVNIYANLEDQLHDQFGINVLVVPTAA